MEHKSCSVYSSVEPLANTTVETAIRALSQLRKQGIVQSTRGSTTIAKTDQLQRLAGP